MNIDLKTPQELKNLHELDLTAERQRVQRWFWYYLCLYVEDERESDGHMCDAIHDNLELIDGQINERCGKKPPYHYNKHRNRSILHWKPSDS